MTVWDWDYVAQITPRMLEGLRVTIGVTFAAFAISLVLGLLLSLTSRSRWRAVRWAGRGVIDFVRGTPLLVQALFMFYVLPDYGLMLSAVATGVIVLGINYSAYLAEVYRASVLSIPAGQWEASRALNLPSSFVWRRVILPQAVRSALPSLGTFLNLMYKETAVLFAIGVPVLLFEARALGNQTYRFLEPYTLAGLLYLLISYPSAVLLRRLEARRG